MKLSRKGFMNTLRFLCLAVVIIVGCLAVIGSSDDGTTTSAAETEEVGAFDYVVTEYVDGDGKITRMNSTKYDDEGTSLGSRDEFYDDEGNLIREEGDDDGDGQNDWSYEYVYDDAGNMTAAEYDEISEGTKRKAHFFYDDKGNLIRREADNDYDGSTFAADEIYSYEYALFGDEWKMTKEMLDEDDDGDIDYTNVFFYDENDNLERLEYGFGEEAVEVYTATYFTYTGIDGDWYTRTSKTDLNFDANIDFSYLYDYDDQGNKSSMKSYIGDCDDDGVMISATYYVYDDTGNLIEEWYDENGDGNDDEVMYTSYYDDGRLWRQEYDRDLNDEIDLTYTWTYEQVEVE